MDFEATLSFVDIEISKELQGRDSVPPGYLDDFLTNKSGLKNMIDDDLRARLTKHLETFYWTRNNDGHSLKDKIKDWYPERILEDGHDPYFWRRLEKYWRDHLIIPRDSIRSTDKVTTEIMNYLGDPRDTTSWRRRGLVMGHVQSGKTTNYSALICKAADAGYRIIIVLAGLTKTLRKQTQVRLDETFVGKSSLGDQLHVATYPVARVFAGMEGEPRDPRHPYCGTTQQEDFNVASARTTIAHEGNFADPILFVTKKNEGTLSKLATWLSALRQGRPLDGPMLLIDDESDNASVNTSKDDVTRINQRIRELLKCSHRYSYVGYTATPFANIFIDPDTNDDMLRDDLFPRHFIKSLDPPDNYIGARNLFSDAGDLAETCVKDIPDDYQDILHLKHKSTHIIEELPESLVKAVNQYIIFRAIRNLDEESHGHSSMMVNVSRFIAVQKQVTELIGDQVARTREAIESWAKSKYWQKSELLVDLQAEWHQQYESCSEHDWEEVLDALTKAISPIEVMMVNMQGTSLDYSDFGDQSRHLIVVGGLALSRGLTLEGLAISYVLRNVGAADTLLQIGRWFGYRPGYANLCRIHLTSDMREHFEHISEAVEELRDDLVRMERLKRTPDEFGLKVRESPTGIAITAANKMRSAEPVKLAADYSLKHVQAFELFADERINSDNYEAARKFHDSLSRSYKDNHVPVKGALVWKDVDAGLIQELLAELELPTMDFVRMGGSGSLISNYIADRTATGKELTEWDVAFPYIMTASSTDNVFERVEFPFSDELTEKRFARQRLSGEWKDVEKKQIFKITRKNVVADAGGKDLLFGDSKEELKRSGEEQREKNPDLSPEKAILSVRKRPILILHLFQQAIDGNSDERLFDESTVAVSVSLGFPGTKIKSIEHTYAATKRMIEFWELEKQRSETETDEVLDED